MNREESLKRVEENLISSIHMEYYISKQAAQNKIKTICNKYGLSYEDGERKPSTGGSAYALGHAFDDLPSITPQKIGKWIEERDDYGEITCWHCSNCYEDSGFITDCKWDYCPNCGTNMKSEEI